MPRWHLDDIPWSTLEPTRVDATVLAVVKSASLVEHNADDYVTYLHNVFADRPEVQADIDRWGEEERQHGAALGRWAEKADPTFDFQAAFNAYQSRPLVPQDRHESVRGSRTGEMLARCVVETGTSSFYTALAQATEEPVLRDLAHRIAADEFRHYKLFRTLMGDFQNQERLTLLRRALVAYERVREAEDEELAWAWHCANRPGQSFDARDCANRYGQAASGLYTYPVVERAVGMIFKVVGLRPRGWLNRGATQVVWGNLRRRAEGGTVAA